MMNRLVAALLLALALVSGADTARAAFPPASPTVLTAPGTVFFNIGGTQTVTLTVTGSPVGATFAIQGSSDQNPATSATWTTLQAVAVGTGSVVTSMSGTGKWQVNTAGMTAVRVNLTALSSGNVSFLLYGDGGLAVIASTNSSGGGGGGGNVNLNQVGGASYALGQTTMSASMPVAVASDQSALPVGSAQGSTTSGESGPLIQGAVTTAAPTYTTGKTNPLSLDTAGNLRVNVVTGGGSGGTSSSFASAFPSTGTAIGAKNGANMVNLAADGSGNLDVNLQTAIPAGTNLMGKVGIDQTTPGTTNGVQVNAALPAGTNLIGKAGIDQTTVGTTNGVSLAQIGTAATAAGNGVTNTGTQRVTLSSDGTGQVTLAAGAATIGALTANQSVNLAQVGGTNTVTGGVNGSQGVGGLAASGASNAGNPVKVGGPFNTTQPTVTNGQAVDAQMTARGAQIVATGVDPFTVTGGYADGTSISGALYSPISGANASGLSKIITCDSHVFKHITTATDTLVVELSSGKKTYICDWETDLAAGTATVYLETATSTTCGGTLAQITGVKNLVANVGEKGSSPFYRGLSTPASDGLCAHSTGTGGFDIDVYYTQF